MASVLRSSGPAIALGASAAATVLVIMGIAGTVMSMQCSAGSAACFGTPALVVTAVTPAEPSKDQERLKTALAPMPQPVAAAPTDSVAVVRDAMITKTFDLLIRPIDVAKVEPAPELATPAAEAPVTAETIAKVELPMATSEARRLTAMRSTVDLIDRSEAARAIDKEVASGSGAGAVPILAYASPVIPAEKPAKQPKTPAKVATQVATQVATKVATADTRTVGGAGVNVRSGPSKSSGKLFALASGAEVTVKENKRGWLHVVDAKGRAGWVYSSFLNR